MTKDHNPLKLMSKIHEYLDNALTENESNKFIKSVQEDPNLAQLLNKEKNLRTIIKNQFQRQQVDSNFINTLKQKLFS